MSTPESPGPTGPRRITLTARLGTSAVDARRGVARLHPEVLAALGVGAWDAVRLTGTRSTVALAAPATGLAVTGNTELDETAMVNTGVVDGTPIAVEPVPVVAARQVVLTGSRLATATVTPETLRLALTGKVLVAGDTVSLLPQDIVPVPGADAAGVRSRLAGALGGTWTTELVGVVATEPAGADAALAVGPTTVVGWRDGPRTGDAPLDTRAGTTGAAGAAPSGPGVVTSGSVNSGSATSGSATSGPATSGSATAGGPGSGPVAGAVPAVVAQGPPPVPVSDLVGQRTRARRLREWLDLVYSRPELLTRLGAAARLGVLLSGPEGVGKTTLVRAVAGELDARVVCLDAPSAAALEAGSAAERVRAACARAADGTAPTVLLVTDVETLLPATDPPPLSTAVLEALREVVAVARVALVATTSHPESVDPRLRHPDLVDRELSLPAPGDRDRAELLGVLLREVPLAGDVDLGAIGVRTPGFVAADLVALRREAAVRAALRSGSAAPDETEDPDVTDEGATERAEPELRVAQADLLGAVTSVRPTSLSTGSQTLSSGGLTLDEVGDMVETKQALTETVLWPLTYPDSFARLGVDPPRGVLLFGPPGCGKTFLVRALAGTGALNVFVVKGAELLDKYVGESERAVRELFRRASDASPALVFLDEVDALAPRRGGSTDAGVADRVVAALLTELDGAEPLRDVVVLGATNRPELIDPALLRPGRLERRIYVPPPDVGARADILRSASRDTPLAADVDLDALAADLDGYSAADCTALVREAALTAMRTSLESSEVSAADLDAARRAVRPSLDPAQLAALQAYAERTA